MWTFHPWHHTQEEGESRVEKLNQLFAPKCIIISLTRMDTFDLDGQLNISKSLQSMTLSLLLSSLSI